MPAPVYKKVMSKELAKEYGRIIPVAPTAPQHLVCRVVQSLHTNHMQMSIIEVFICRRLHMNTSMILICIWLVCRLCTTLHITFCRAVPKDKSWKFHSFCEPHCLRRTTTSWNRLGLILTKMNGGPLQCIKTLSSKHKCQNCCVASAHSRTTSRCTVNCYNKSTRPNCNINYLK